MERSKGACRMISPTSIDLRIAADDTPLNAALAALLQLAERFPERVELLLRGIGGASKLVRLDLDVLPASGASDLRVRFQPSDALLRFLAAMRAVDADFVAVDNSLHESSVSMGSVGGTSILSTCEGSPFSSGQA
jgi:hypothetical protein